MATGGYNRLATLVLHKARAAGALVLILGGDRGTGFSVDVTPDMYSGLPAFLRRMADDVQADLERRNAAIEDSLICGGCGETIPVADMNVLPGNPPEARCSRCLGEEASRG